MRPFIACWLGSHALAAPLTVENFKTDGVASRPWYVPGATGMALAAGVGTSLKVAIPPLTDKEQKVGGTWRGVITLDLYGTESGKQGEIIFKAVDAASGELIAKDQTSVSGKAPRAAWAVIASSQQRRGEARRAFDGDLSTQWQSSPQAAGMKTPQWIGLELGEPFALPGIRCTPRSDGNLKGVAKTFRLEVRKPGSAWETALTGEAKQHEVLNLQIPNPVPIEAFRFVIESDHGNGFGSVAEIKPIGLALESEKALAVTTRIWLEIPPKMIGELEGKSMILRVENSPATTVIVGNPQFARVHTAPSAKLFSRVNGGKGPDQLGAGLLGFTALMEHEQTVLSVISVLAKSPAASAGLKAGDVIIGISGKTLPLNSLAPGWEWFHHGHEAAIGRAIEHALKAGETTLPLTVLRDGRPVTLDISLRRNQPFTTLDPASDPQAAALLADQLAFIERTQRADGSWSGDIIRTTFSALALMATRDVKYRDRVAKAVGWAMKKYPTPESYGRLGFWPGSYACILYSEWHLATGDETVLPRLRALRDWALTADFTCRWNVRALGHGTQGIPYDKKALVAPACHLLVFEALAMRCGMESGVWELIFPYMELSWSDPAKGGHGALGYNPSYKDKQEFWSRSGLFAIASHLRHERTDMRDAMIGFMGNNYPWFRASHAYGEPGGALGLLALNLITPDAFARILPEYAWSFALGWEPGHGLRYTHPHMGSLHMGEEDLMNACYALVLQAPKRTLHLTGTTERGFWAID